MLVDEQCELALKQVLKVAQPPAAQVKLQLQAFWDKHFNGDQAAARTVQLRHLRHLLSTGPGSSGSGGDLSDFPVLVQPSGAAAVEGGSRPLLQAGGDSRCRWLFWPLPADVPGGSELLEADLAAGGKVAFADRQVSAALAPHAHDDTHSPHSQCISLRRRGKRAWHCMPARPGHP